MASTQDSWSNIPPELAGLILGLLHAHVDRVRFAAVCPQWRTAARQVRLPPPLPLLVLKSGDTFYSMPKGEPLRFAGCKSGFVTACGKWLVYRRFRELVLVDPFSGATAMTLPAPSRIYLPGEDRSVDPSDDGLDSADEVEDSKDAHDYAYEGDVTEDGSAQSWLHLPDKDAVGDSRNGYYSTHDGEDYEGDHDSADEGNYSDDCSIYTDDSELLMDLKCFEVIKLLECSPNLFVALLRGSEFNRIAMCRPGGSKWSIVWEISSTVTDMAFYKGKLYVVGHYEDLLTLSIRVDDKTGDPQVSRIRTVFNIGQYDIDRDQTLLKMLYLVESCGSLLMVRRMIFHTHVHGEGQIHTFAGQCEPNLSIFEADFTRSQWAKVTTLVDNQALFVGPCSRAICMPEGDSQGNRVWFLDDYKDFQYWNEYRYSNSLSSDTSSVANPKPFSPLPMISWKGYKGFAGAAWLFPGN